MGTFLGDALIIRAGIFCGCGTLGMLQWDSSLLTCPECDNVFIWSDGRLQNGRLQMGGCRIGKLFSSGCIHVILGVLAVCMCAVNICALSTFGQCQWWCFCCAAWQVFWSCEGVKA